ncbi:MAG: cytochrome P450 [Saprospiraceae bacterium]
MPVKTLTMVSELPVFKGKNPLIPGTEFLMDPFRFTTGKGMSLGSFYRIPFFFRKIFVTTDIEAIAHVLQRNQKNYRKSFAYRNLRLALGNGLVTNEGESWFQQRRLIQPGFHKAKLEGLFVAMGEVAERYFADLRRRTEKPAVLDLSVEMMKVTADIVLKTLFSTDNKADIAEMYRIMVDAQDYLVDRTTKPYFIPFYYVNGRHRHFRKDMDWFDRQLYALVDERRAMANRPNDLLTMLLEARDADTGEAMSDQQLRDEAITLFAAGHETSSNGLSWILYLLSQHPEVLRSLRNEVDEVLGDRTPTFDDLPGLSYTMQVIKEGMRLYPPAFAIGREPIEDDVILGHRVPAGSVVFIAIAAVHRNPDWYERPTDFYPEHFLPEAEKERPRLAYMPFGAGPRMCIGNHFALIEMQLLLAMLVRRFNFELLPGHPIKPEPLITLKPRYGVKMRVGWRES